MSPLQMKLLIGAGALVLLGLLIWLLVENLQESATDAGGAIVSAQHAEEGLKTTETANEAREKSRNRSADQQYADCRLYAKNPDDC